MQACGRKNLRLWLATTCVPLVAKDALTIPLPPVVPVSGSIRTDLGGEGAEPVYVEGVEDDEHYPLNTSFSEEETVEARALLPRLGRHACSKWAQNLVRQVHHRLCQLRWLQLAGGPQATSSVPRKPSKMGLEDLKRTAYCETPRLGQDCSHSVEDAPQSGVVTAER